MNDWLHKLAELQQRSTPSVLITVASTKGSTPREAGTKMIVTQDSCLGTIGGGNLEFKAIEIARKLLSRTDSNKIPATLKRFPLGPSLGQCCGGVADLLFEHLPANPIMPFWIDILLEQQRLHKTAALVTSTEASATANKLIVTMDDYTGRLDDTELEQQAVKLASQLLNDHNNVKLCTIERLDKTPVTLLFEPLKSSDFHIALFGAGHVGKALVQVLSNIPCTIDWIDSRADEFPQQLPANVTALISDEPDYEVDDLPAGSYVLIMTHSHPLDQAICNRALRRDDLAYCGLIGSTSKLNKFRKRMMLQGLPDEALARLTCPIGVSDIPGKHPGEIAIAVAAQLLQVRK